MSANSIRAWVSAIMVLAYLWLFWHLLAIWGGNQ